MGSAAIGALVPDLCWLKAHFMVSHSNQVNIIGSLGVKATKPASVVVLCRTFAVLYHANNHFLKVSITVERAV